MSDDDEPREPTAYVTSNGYRTHAYYLPDALHARLKAAWWSTRDSDESAPSLSTLVARIMEEEATRLEALFNEGDQFPPAPRNARGVDPAAARRQGDAMGEFWAGSRPRPHKPQSRKSKE